MLEQVFRFICDSCGKQVESKPLKAGLLIQGTVQLLQSMLPDNWKTVEYSIICDECKVEVTPKEVV